VIVLYVHRKKMFRKNLELKRKQAEAAQTQRKKGMNLLLLRDPIEDDEKTGILIKKIQEKISSKFEKPMRGQCHILWNETKRVLWEEHQIEWYSPREMNPGVKFD